MLSWLRCTQVAIWVRVLNIYDAEHFLIFIDKSYQNRTADTSGLAPRKGC